MGKVGRVDTTFAGEKETTDTVEQEWGLAQTTRPGTHTKATAAKQGR